MEINRFEDVIGVRVTEDIVEGRFVVLTAHNLGGDFINVDADVPGAKLPDTAEEAKRARFCLTFAVDNRPTPIVDWPQTAFDFRGGWVNAQAGPLTGLKMWLTHPGNQENQTVPSGYKALAFGQGTYTIPSGQYIYNANLRTPGAAVMIADATTDGAGSAGKPKYQATLALGYVGFVQVYDETTGALTIRIEG
jgi:hypothetical protein